MKLDKIISSIEKKWLKKLFEASRACYEGIHLPSHNHWHHYRVWQYTKELIRSASPVKNFNNSEITNLIIASFFHDTGMSITRDERHGKESKQLCQKFFNKNQIREPINFDMALEAIEHHDNKNYPESSNNKDISLKTILSIADDLDAFGYIGILRYAEIYLLRKTPINELTNKVINNAEKRYIHFEANFKASPDLIRKHHKRLEILIQFYKNLNDKRAYRRLIEQINKNIAEAHPNNLTELINGYEENNSYFLEFKNNVKNELAIFEE